MAACAFARGYLNGVMGTAFQHLRDEGIFFDPVEREVQDSFLPWLFSNAATHLETEEQARGAMRAVVLAALKSLEEAKQAAEQGRLDEERRQEEERARQAEVSGRATTLWLSRPVRRSPPACPLRP